MADVLGTFLSGQLILAPLLVDAVPAAIKGNPVLMGSSVVIERPGLPVGPDGRPSATVQVPYWSLMGGYQRILHEGDGVAPSTFGLTSELATSEHYALGADISQFAQSVSPASQDPYGEATRQMRILEVPVLDAVVMRVMTAAPPAGYLFDESTAIVEVDMIKDAKQIWGDDRNRFQAEMFVDNDTYTYLSKIKDSIGRYLLTDPQGNDKFSRLDGMPVHVSDNMPAAVGGVHTSIIAWPGTVVIWRAPPLFLTQADASANTRAIYAHMYLIAHRYSRYPQVDRFGSIQLKHLIG